MTFPRSITGRGVTDQGVPVQFTITLTVPAAVAGCTNLPKSITTGVGQTYTSPVLQFVDSANQPVVFADSEVQVAVAGGNATVSFVGGKLVVNGKLVGGTQITLTTPF